MIKHTSTAAVAAALIGISVFLPCQLVAAEGSIKPGDTIVVLQDTHLRVGKEKLPLVTRGTELVAEHVEDRWVWVSIRLDGRTVQGWVHRGHLVSNARDRFGELLAHNSSKARFTRLLIPTEDGYSGMLTPENLRRTAPDGFPTAKREPALARSADRAVQLMDRDGDGRVSEREFMTQPATIVFLRLDQNNDHQLSNDEFLNAARKPTLDDLNGLLRAVFASDSGVREIGVLTPIGGLNLTICIRDFEGWLTEPTFNQRLDIVKDFVDAKDVRRSRLARQLADPEDPMVRSRRAQALFKWADKNSDGKLAIDEFQQALPERREIGGGEKDD